MSGNSTTQSEPWTILRLLQWTTEHLKKHGSSSPRLDAEVLLADARMCQRIDLYAAFNEEPPEEVKARFRDFVRRRAAGEPVAYIIGKKEFYSLPFRVDAHCLIPRGETEHVVIEALDRLKATPWPVVPNVADICTGSGCIAVAVAKHFPNLKMTAVDLSAEALQVASDNIASHQLSDRVHAVLGDLLSTFSDDSLDMVLSNPPYVSDAEFENLDPTVRKFEPKMALVSGPLGTELIERLRVECHRKLRKGGWLICELSPMIADSVRDAFTSDPMWASARLVRDLAGKQRVLVAQRAS